MLAGTAQEDSASRRSIRGTHSAIQVVTVDGGVESDAGEGASTPPSGTQPPAATMHNTHYIVSWGNQSTGKIPRTDLYPQPADIVRLAMRPHVFATTPTTTSGNNIGFGGSASRARPADGCTAGSHAAAGCVTFLPPGAAPTIPATKGAVVSLLALHEPLSNGAFFLGELDKFVHTSPQRFAQIQMGGSGPVRLFLLTSACLVV
jgi:hypothetical protein